MRVKICGISSLDEAIMCEDMGADAIGLVHYPGRRRSMDLGGIGDIARSMGPFISAFLVCRPSGLEDATRMLEMTGAQGIQAYSLSPSEMSELRKSGYKVIRAVRPEREEAERYAHHVDALLFEAGIPGMGHTYDYRRVPMDIHPRTIIAGGLNIDNIEEAKRLRPYGVDVSSGVEGPDGKDPRLVREFIRRCRS